AAIIREGDPPSLNFRPLAIRALLQRPNDDRGEGAAVIKQNLPLDGRATLQLKIRLYGLIGTKLDQHRICRNRLSSALTGALRGIERVNIARRRSKERRSAGLYVREHERAIQPRGSPCRTSKDVRHPTGVRFCA